MEWYSVNDKLPEDGEDVLVSLSPNGVPFTRIGLHRDGVWYLLYGMWGDYHPLTNKKTWPVTHWAPLPTPN